jgi:hypothetical protein
VKDVPEEYKHDLDYIVNMLDWEANVDPNFYANHYLDPKPVKPLKEMRAEGYEEYHIVYNSEYFGAKELTILPKHFCNNQRKTQRTVRLLCRARVNSACLILNRRP